MWYEYFVYISRRRGYLVDYSKQMDSKSFGNKVNGFRFFFSIMILLGHAASRWDIGNFRMLLFIYPAMTFFYFFSGYFYAFSSNKYTKSDLLVRKTRSLLVPWLIWRIIGIFFFFMFHFLRGEMIPKECFRFSLRYGNSVVDFMLKLFFLMVVAMILKPIFKNKWGGSILLLLYAMAEWYFDVPYDTFIWWAFFAGYYIGQNFSSSFEKLLSNNETKWYGVFAFPLWAALIL